MTLDDIKEQIKAQMGEVELLDFLDISIEELVEILEDQIIEKIPEFEETFR